MPYSYITFLQARNQLAARLGDSGKVFWIDDELKRLFTESLRTWNSITRYWKARMQFPTIAATPFYDLTAQAGSLIPYTVTDQTIIGLMQYSLLEPCTPTAWTGTAMFTLSDFTNALQRRRNQFLLETGMVITNSQPAMPPVPVSRVPLSDSVINPRWVWFLDAATSTYFPLWRSDEFALNAFSRGWAQNADTPAAYSVSVTPPLSLQVAPTPVSNGSLDMLSINAPADLNPATGVLMNVPNDFTWALRFGALADLLSQDGKATDVTRAAYCEQRYREGVELARMATSVMQAQIDDVPVQVISIQEFETYRRSWRNSSGTPDTLAMAGFNMVALADVPDGVYSVTIDLVRNAPVPTLDSDPVQIGREELDVVTGYAQHLGSFKQGGAELQATKPLYEAFYRLGSEYNEVMRSNATFFDVLKDRAIRPQVTKSYREATAQGAQ